MGHPKFARPKYDTPTHPWKKARIEEEHALKEQFGLKKIGGMKEIWKGKSKLRRWRQNAMKLIGRVDTSEGHFSREKDDLVESLIDVVYSGMVQHWTIFYFLQLNTF